MGSVSRPEGCVLTCPNSSGVPSLCSVHVPKGKVQVRSPPVRSLDLTEGLHPGRGSSRGRATASRRTTLCVPGRLADPRGLSGPNRSQRRSDDLPSRKLGLGDQLGQVAFHPFTGTVLSRGTTLPQRGPRVQPSEKLFGNSSEYPVPAAHETAAASSPILLETGVQGPSGSRVVVPLRRAPPPVVAR